MKGNQAEQAVFAIDALIKKTKPIKSTTMKSAIVALFTADAEGQFRYSGLIGMLHLDIDRSFGAPFLRIYDLESLKMVFEVELYYGFGNEYKQRTPVFYTFEYPRGVIGFLFKNEEEAQIFCVKVKSQAPSMDKYNEIRAKKIEEERIKRKEGSFFGKFKKTLFGKEE